MRHLVLVCSLLAACNTAESPPTQADAQPVVAPAAAPAVAPAQMADGVVKETFVSAGYTYVRMDSAGKEVWLAGPPTPVEVGDTVQVGKGTQMLGFHSKSLDRTFDEILFVSAIHVNGATAKAPASHGSPHAAPPSNPVLKSFMAPSGDGQTVADFYANAAAWNGQQKAVRGKVVKFTPAIMGKNWVHLQDGTGDAGGGTNDLTVTTSATVAVDDTVTLQGVVAADKDFGAGYHYAVVIEDAVVVP